MVKLFCMTTVFVFLMSACPDALIVLMSWCPDVLMSWCPDVLTSWLSGLSWCPCGVWKPINNPSSHFDKSINLLSSACVAAVYFQTFNSTVDWWTVEGWRGLPKTAYCVASSHWLPLEITNDFLVKLTVEVSVNRQFALCYRHVRYVERQLSSSQQWCSYVARQLTNQGGRLSSNLCNNN